MQSKKIIGVCVAIMLCAGIPCSFAQKNKNKEADAANAPVIVFLPEFYHREATNAGDTTFKYECYDDKDKLVNIDTLRHSDIVDEIWLVKSFFDRRFKGGVGISPPYLTQKIVTYYKADKDTWAVRYLAGNQNEQLKGDIHNIARADTTIAVNPATRSNQLTIRKYYRLTVVPAGNEVPVHEH